MFTMVYHTMGYHGNTMVYHGLPCLHHGIAWHTMFAGNLHTRTAVARLPLHQLDYLVVNWSNHVTQIDGQSWADMWLQRNKNTAVVAIIGLCIQQLCGGSSHWMEDKTNSNRQKYFRWVEFFSRISCVFKCWYLINGKQRITTDMMSSSIFYGKGCVCAGHFVMVSYTK